MMKNMKSHIPPEPVLQGALSKYLWYRAQNMLQTGHYMRILPETVCFFEVLEQFIDASVNYVTPR